jgi:hypothetical protein
MQPFQAPQPRKPQLERPIIINHRKYWRQSTIDAFKEALQAYALGKDPPPPPPPSPEDPLRPAIKVAREFGVTVRTIDRWWGDGRSANEAA